MKRGSVCSQLWPTGSERLFLQQAALCLGGGGSLTSDPCYTSILSAFISHIPPASERHPAVVSGTWMPRSEAAVLCWLMVQRSCGLTMQWRQRRTERRRCLTTTPDGENSWCLPRCHHRAGIPSHSGWRLDRPVLCLYTQQMPQILKYKYVRVIKATKLKVIYRSNPRITALSQEAPRFSLNHLSIFGDTTRVHTSDSAKPGNRCHQE